MAYVLKDQKGLTVGPLHSTYQAAFNHRAGLNRPDCRVHEVGVPDRERLEANERLDRLAAIPSSAEGKNHVHACRYGHPLGRDNQFKWRTAYATVASRADFGNQPDRKDLDWLRAQADAERAEHRVVINEAEWAATCERHS